MADATIPGWPTGDPATWPTPPGGAWRQVATSPGGSFIGFALDVPGQTGYVAPHKGAWFIDPEGDGNNMPVYATGDEAVRALTEWFSR